MNKENLQVADDSDIPGLTGIESVFFDFSQTEFCAAELLVFKPKLDKQTKDTAATETETDVRAGASETGQQNDGDSPAPKTEHKVITNSANGKKPSAKKSNTPMKKNEASAAKGNTNFELADILTKSKKPKGFDKRNFNISRHNMKRIKTLVMRAGEKNIRVTQDDIINKVLDEYFDSVGVE